MFIIESILSTIKIIAVCIIICPILIYITVAIINKLKSSTNLKRQQKDSIVVDDVWHADVDITDINKNQTTTFHQEKNSYKPNSTLNPIFTDFDNYVHKQQEQQIRIKKADSPFIYVSNISNDKNTATIIGDNGEKYTTTFSSCTCQDFKNRHLPCKHMYKLAFYTGRMKPEDWYEGEHDFQNQNIIPSQISNNFKGHNMSMNLYKVRSIFKETNHIRTFRISALSEQDAIEHISEEYISPPKSIEIENYPVPTERQIVYATSLGISLPTKCCQYDLSALLNNNDDISAPQTLQQFAIGERILFSLYLDESHLIRILFTHYKKYSAQQIAFLMAYIYKERTGNWIFTKWNDYIQYGNECLTDSSFINSFKRNHNNFAESGTLSPKTFLYQNLSKYFDEEKIQT